MEVGSETACEVVIAIGGVRRLDVTEYMAEVWTWRLAVVVAKVLTVVTGEFVPRDEVVRGVEALLSGEVTEVLAVNAVDVRLAVLESDVDCTSEFDGMYE